MSYFNQREMKLNNEIVNLVGKLCLSLPLNSVIDKMKEWIPQRAEALAREIQTEIKEKLAVQRGVPVEEIPTKGIFDAEHYDLLISYQMSIGKVYSKYTDLEDESWPPLIAAMYLKSVLNRRIHLIAFRRDLILTNRFHLY